MLPTFVIGLREGLEAALIVGIVAAFLRQKGRRDALRWMWLGVTVAIVLCTAAGVALRIAEENLPQKEQEQLETVIALLAVGMITWMIVWMRRHSAGLRGELEERARPARSPRVRRVRSWGWRSSPSCARGSRRRCSCVAAFQQSSRPGLTGTGAVLGVAARERRSDTASTAAACAST